MSAMLCGCAVSHRSTAAAAATTDTGSNARRYLGAETGYATFLASSFHGNESASGEVFDTGKLVAAHRTLPFGSIVRVTNLENGRSVTVRIIDRGPYGKNYREGTIIDLSRAAARRVRMMQEGQVRVRLLVLRLGAEG
jgi:rare lipoprotein A